MAESVWGYLRVSGLVSTQNKVLRGTTVPYNNIAVHGPQSFILVLTQIYWTSVSTLNTSDLSENIQEHGNTFNAKCCVSYNSKKRLYAENLIDANYSNAQLYKNINQAAS